MIEKLLKKVERKLRHRYVVVEVVTKPGGSQVMTPVAQTGSVLQAAWFFYRQVRKLDGKKSVRYDLRGFHWSDW